MSAPVSRATKALIVAYRGYKDGSVDFLGDQVSLLTGYSREEFADRIVKWTDLIQEDDRKSVRTALVEALKTDRTYTREYRITARNGFIKWIQEWSQIICHANGEIDYITGIIMDITNAKLEELSRLKYERRNGEYLILSLHGQEFGIGINKIKEVIELTPITNIPNSNPSLKGVINLRGKSVPVVDLGSMINMNTSCNTFCSNIIVIEREGAENDSLVGIIADSVSEVLYINGIDILDPPLLIEKYDLGYIVGMVHIRNTFRIIVDIDKLLCGFQYKTLQD